MVGFDVTPLMPSSSISFLSPPSCSSVRARLSYQGLWPKSLSRAIAEAMVAPYLPWWLGLVEQRACALDDVLGGDAELGHDGGSVRRGAEPVDRHRRVGVALPAERRAGLDGHAWHTCREDLLAVGVVLRREQVPGGHRDDAHAASTFLQRVARRDAVLHLG